MTNADNAQSWSARPGYWTLEYLDGEANTLQKSTSLPHFSSSQPHHRYPQERWHNKGRRTLTTHMTGVMVVWPRPMTPCRWRRHPCRRGGRIWRRSWRRLIGSIVLGVVRSVYLIQIRGCDIWMSSKALRKGSVTMRRIRRRWAKVCASRGVRRRRRSVGIIGVARFVRERLLVT